MNLFILLELPDGSKELVTPPLSTGVILPGVTRWTFCVPATIIVISDGVKSHLYIDFHTYTWLFKVFFSTTQHLFCQGLNAKEDNLGTVKHKIPLVDILGHISVDTKITVWKPKTDICCKCWANSPLKALFILRRSIIEMTSTWPGLTVSERKITMGEVGEQ